MAYMNMKKSTIITALTAMMLVAVGLTGCKYFKPLDGPGMERDSTDLSALGDSVSIGDSLNVVADDAAQKQNMEAVQAFVEQFYNEWGMENLLYYDYPKQHITPRLLKFLADSYEFECEGECLATWKFFYEGGGDVGEFKSRQITARDGNHVLVENKYVNYEYDVLLTVIKDGDTFKIDSLQQEVRALNFNEDEY
jgi:hypothetical protein